MVTVRRLGDFVGLAASFLAVGYGAYLLVIGRAVGFLTPEGDAGTFMEPSLVGVLPLGIGLIGLWAVVRRRTIGLWAATVLAAALAVLLLFSLSLQFAGLAALLLVAAALTTVSARRGRHR